MLPIQPGIPGESLLFMVNAMGYFTCPTHHTPAFAPSEGQSVMVKCLAEGLGFKPTHC